MGRLSRAFDGVTDTAGRFGEMSLDILQDRLALLSLELREAKIRFFQALFLASLGVVACVLGLLLLILAGVFFLPPEWRLFGLLAMGIAAVLAGVLAFVSLGRRLDRNPLAFAQTLEELKKDAACFSTEN
ncbi:hypothetical protein dsx2_3193 [Desulfovibrio sp. X2]|uniref:phage holin family protein n=1 Tax=Desulfovibrio sp. X2 TaxID=941449 RepID=UPI000358EC61|nr:phage holin family protein [Desulfovibrio sp. X2]EPR41440.1 hypothetical protein dsx2_3193 [Desulfovibrio sp. X2]